MSNMDEKWTGEEFEAVLESLFEKGLIQAREEEGEIKLDTTDFGNVIAESWGDL